MKKLATAVALCAALGAFTALPAHAESNQSQAMQTVKSMKKDKDGMITKAEFMRMVEQKWDGMALAERGGRLTPEEAATLLTWLASGGTAP